MRPSFQTAKIEMLISFIVPVLDFLKRFSSLSPSCESTNLGRVSGCGPEGEYLGKWMSFLCHCQMLHTIQAQVHQRLMKSSSKR